MPDRSCEGCYIPTAQQTTHPTSEVSDADNSLPTVGLIPPELTKVTVATACRDWLQQAEH